MLSQRLCFAGLQGLERLENAFLVAAECKNLPRKGSAGLPVPLKHKLPGSSSSIPTVVPYVLCLVSC